MKLIVCLDDENGILFNNRRQSQDRLVRADMLRMTCGTRLWMNAYSLGQFSQGDTANICVDERFWERAGEDDYCFAENAPLQDCIHRASQIIIYRWNRVYPASVRFPDQVLTSWKQQSSGTFAGYSHEEISREVYIP